MEEVIYLKTKLALVLLIMPLMVVLAGCSAPATKDTEMVDQEQTETMMDESADEMMDDGMTDEETDGDMDDSGMMEEEATDEAE